MAARLSRGVELPCLVLTKTLLARPLLMPLPHAYTSPCTVQLCRRVVKPAPHPAVNVGIGAHSVTPTAHATRAGVSGEADVVAGGNHAAGGVAAAIDF